MAALTGVLMPRVEPGSAEWLRTMSASKIAAVVGLSPYESRFSLWHRMAGLIPPQPDTTLTRRGHYLEPAIAAWFADQHPDWPLSTTGTWAHPERPWQTASPDLIASTPDGPDIPVECKTATAGDWGTPGSGDVPPGYKCQTMWQMDTIGAPVCHIAVLRSYLDFAEYVVAYDEDDAAYLRDQAQAFMDSLPGGPAEQRPDVDDHDATYQAVRALHPGIEDRDVEVDPDLAVRYLDAVAGATAADTDLRAAKAALLDVMGDAHRATHFDHPIAARRPARGGAVALYPTRSTT